MFFIALCQAFGGGKDAESFLQFIGSTAYLSGQSPLSMSFNFSAGSSAMSLSATDCGTDDEVLGCLCGDCSSACPARPNPSGTHGVPHFTIGEMKLKGSITHACTCFQFHHIR